MTSIPLIHVAVGVVFNQQGQVLVALRPHHVDQGGLWEFPGGKVEVGETTQQALIRELYEETGIAVHAAQPLVKVEHEYPNKKVLLDVWKIEKFSGEPKACEAQTIVKWVSLTELESLAIPAANHPIVRAVLKISQ